MQYLLVFLHILLWHAHFYWFFVLCVWKVKIWAHGRPESKSTLINYKWRNKQPAPKKWLQINGRLWFRIVHGRTDRGVQFRRNKSKLCEIKRKKRYWSRSIRPRGSAHTHPRLVYGKRERGGDQSVHLVIWNKKKSVCKNLISGQTEKGMIVSTAESTAAPCEWACKHKRDLSLVD